MIYLDIYICCIFFLCSYCICRIFYCETHPMVMFKTNKTVSPFVVKRLQGTESRSVVRLHLFPSSLLNRFKLMQFCQEHLMELSYLSWAYTPVPFISIQIQFQLEKQTRCYCPFVKTSTLA